jgi:F-type H+-transporting ATPase subunit c
MKKLQYMFMALAGLLLATPAFAQGGDASSHWYVSIAAGIGMAIAAGLCGLGQGKAFIESLALFTFVIIFLKVQP